MSSHSAHRGAAEQGHLRSLPPRARPPARQGMGWARCFGCNVPPSLRNRASLSHTSSRASSARIDSWVEGVRRGGGHRARLCAPRHRGSCQARLPAGGCLRRWPEQRSRLDDQKRPRAAETTDWIGLMGTLRPNASASINLLPVNWKKQCKTAAVTPPGKGKTCIALPYLHRCFVALSSPDSTRIPPFYIERNPCTKPKGRGAA